MKELLMIVDIIFLFVSQENLLLLSCPDFIRLSSPHHRELLWRSKFLHPLISSWFFIWRNF